jgi:hypothetical protein
MHRDVVRPRDVVRWIEMALGGQILSARIGDLGSRLDDEVSTDNQGCWRKKIWLAPYSGLLKA